MPIGTTQKTKDAFTVLQHRTAQNTRHNLVELKWAIDEAIRAGNTPERIAKTMGAPWTDILILEAFPDIARKYKLTKPKSAKHMPRI